MPPATACTEPPPRALLFDLGGVILDVHLDRTLAHWATASAIPGLDTAALRSRFREDEAYRSFECGRSDARRFFAALGGQLGLELSEANWHAGWAAMLGEVRAAMADLLATLAADMPLYLFSNTNALHHAVWRESCAPVLKHFRMCFVSHEIGARKPDRIAFERVVAAIGEPPSSILFFDDLQANIEGAHAVGLRAERVASHRDTLAALGRHGIRCGI
jgi:putative hydrolase of the HAD superfamily